MTKTENNPGAHGKRVAEKRELMQRAASGGFRRQYIWHTRCVRTESRPRARLERRFGGGPLLVGCGGVGGEAAGRQGEEGPAQRRPRGGGEGAAPAEGGLRRLGSREKPGNAPEIPKQTGNKQDLCRRRSSSRKNSPDDTGARAAPGPEERRKGQRARAEAAAGARSRSAAARCGGAMARQADSARTASPDPPAPALPRPEPLAAEAPGGGSGRGTAEPPRAASRSRAFDDTKKQQRNGRRVTHVILARLLQKSFGWVGGCAAGRRTQRATSIRFATQAARE